MIWFLNQDSKQAFSFSFCVKMSDRLHRVFDNLSPIHFRKYFEIFVNFVGLIAMEVFIDNAILSLPTETVYEEL